jgi:hypothetical protein
MRSLAYTNDCKSELSHKRAQKSLLSKAFFCTKSEAGDKKPAAQRRRVYESINKTQLPNALKRFCMSISPFLATTYRNPFAVPQPAEATEKNGYTSKVSATRRAEPVERAKCSKQNRREAAAVSHGDFRRSLYEVTVISMLKPQSRGENA